MVSPSSYSYNKNIDKGKHVHKFKEVLEKRLLIVTLSKFISSLECTDNDIVILYGYLNIFVCVEIEKGR